MSHIRAYQGCRLHRVIDGDSCELIVDLGFRIFARETFRLAGLDCPERGTPEGLAAKHFAASWFERHPTFAVLSQKVPENGNASLNAALLAAGHARPYDGGKR